MFCNAKCSFRVVLSCVKVIIVMLSVVSSYVMLRLRFCIENSHGQTHRQKWLLNSSYLEKRPPWPYANVVKNKSQAIFCFVIYGLRILN